MKKRIYIAGKVTGLPYEQVEMAFFEAERQLLKDGFLAINPLEVVNDPKANWQTAMKLCIAEMMKADAVYLIEHWANSPGALIEKELAEKVGIPAFTEYEKLQKHFGRYPQALCTHQERFIRVLSSIINCETTVTACALCGKELTEPKTDCR